MIQINNLTKSFGTRVLFDNLSLKLNAETKSDLSGVTEQGNQPSLKSSWMKKPMTQVRSSCLKTTVSALFVSICTSPIRVYVKSVLPSLQVIWNTKFTVSKRSCLGWDLPGGFR